MVRDIGYTIGDSGAEMGNKLMFADMCWMTLQIFNEFFDIREWFPSSFVGIVT